MLAHDHPFPLLEQVFRLQHLMDRVLAQGEEQVHDREREEEEEEEEEEDASIDERPAHA